jgi:hypothetical protein
MTMSKIVTDLDSKNWYRFIPMLFNAYPEDVERLTEIFLFSNEPKLRYIAAKLGKASTSALVILLDEYNSSATNKEENEATITQLLKSSSLGGYAISYYLKNGTPIMIASILSNPTFEHADYKKLITNSNLLIRQSYAEHAPFEYLMPYIDDPKDKHNLLESILKNKNLSEDILSILLDTHSQDKHLIRIAARHNNLPYATKIEWAKIEDVTLQRSLSSNANLEEEIQDLLSFGSDERTLINLASNHNLSPHIGKRLLSSLYSPEIHFALSRNAKLNLELGLILANSENSNIRAETVKHNLNLTSNILVEIAADETEYSVIKQIASRPETLDCTWKLLFGRVIGKQGNIGVLYGKKLNSELISLSKNYLPLHSYYLLYLQPNYKVRSVTAKNDNLINAISRAIRYSIDNSEGSTTLEENVDKAFLAHN